MMRSATVCSWFWAAIAGFGAQTAIAPETLLLARIKVRMSETLAALPNYTCVQTIERSRRRAPDRRFEFLDNVRLEVALVDGKELFAWPGATVFEERELANMVGGTIGNGNFALHAKSVFMGRSATHRPAGEEQFRGRRAVRYEYEVSQLQSGYNIRVSPREAMVGYHGQFWVDAETLDLMRLEVVADDIPPFLGVSLARDVMDYERMQIGEASFLLPSASELTMVDLHGNEHRNRTVFAGCRHYAGESRLSFDDPPDGDIAPKGSLERYVRLELPPRVQLALALESEIDSATAAVGDPVEARLTRPIRHHGQIVAPKGARVSGRLIRLEKYRSPYEHYIVGLQFDTLEFADTRAEFSATMVDVGPANGLIREQPRRIGPGHRPGRGAYAFASIEGKAGQGFLRWKAGRLRLPRGLLMFWRTDSGSESGR
jgi:hypothetical protein